MPKNQNHYEALGFRLPENSRNSRELYKSITGISQEQINHHFNQAEQKHYRAEKAFQEQIQQEKDPLKRSQLQGDITKEQENFNKVREAYQCLANLEKRPGYDRKLSETITISNEEKAQMGHQRSDESWKKSSPKPTHWTFNPAGAKSSPEPEPDKKETSSYTPTRPGKK